MLACTDCRLGAQHWLHHCWLSVGSACFIYQWLGAKNAVSQCISIVNGLVQDCSISRASALISEVQKFFFSLVIDCQEDYKLKLHGSLMNIVHLDYIFLWNIVLTIID